MSDLIDRQKAINVADSTDYLGLAVEDVKRVTDEVVKRLKKLPSAQPEPQWIPCSERLPEDYHEYLCCDVHGEYIIGVPYADEEANNGFSAECDSTYMIDCVAWMPLPEPISGRK